LRSLQRQADPFIRAVAEFIDANALIAPGEAVVAAVSGGADSVAMASVLNALADSGGRSWRLTIAHLDHQLRQDSRDDERFVRELAAGWSLPCVTAARDVAAEATRTGGGLEEAARMVRYSFLVETAQNLGAGVVAVGHQADDNVETILYRLARGTHLRGLAGMSPGRSLAGSDIRLVRPLLQCRRQEVEQYCRRAGLQWRTDHTNAEVRYRRNFIRHELLPAIREKLNPRVDEALLRLAGAASQVEAYLLEKAAEPFGSAVRPSPAGSVALDRAALKASAPVIRQFVIRLALERLSAPLGDMSAARYEELAALVEDGLGGGVSLPGGWVARREGPLLVLSRGKTTMPPAHLATVVLICPGTTELGGGLSIRCRVGPIDREAFERHRRQPVPGVEFVDAGCLRGPLVCRPRTAADAFRPLGCDGSQSVSDFLTNRKVRRDLRTKVLCVRDDLGIVYLVPLRIDQRVRVGPRTAKVLCIEACGF